MGVFSGDGSAVNGLSGGNVASSTVVDAWLFSHVVRLNASKAFTGSITFSNATTTFATGAGRAVIQGLNQEVEDLKNELNRQDVESAQLMQRLEKPEKQMAEKLRGMN